MPLGFFGESQCCFLRVPGIFLILLAPPGALWSASFLCASATVWLNRASLCFCRSSCPRAGMVFQLQASFCISGFIFGDLHFYAQARCFGVVGPFGGLNVPFGFSESVSAAFCEFLEVFFLCAGGVVWLHRILMRLGRSTFWEFITASALGPGPLGLHKS